MQDTHKRGHKNAVRTKTTRALCAAVQDRKQSGIASRKHEYAPPPCLRISNRKTKLLLLLLLLIKLLLLLLLPPLFLLLLPSLCSIRNVAMLLCVAQARCALRLLPFAPFPCSGKFRGICPATSAEVRRISSPSQRKGSGSLVRFPEPRSPPEALVKAVTESNHPVDGGSGLRST